MKSSLSSVVASGRNADDARRTFARLQNGWRGGVLVVRLDDDRLTWPEKELIRQIGEKLYGARHGRD